MNKKKSNKHKDIIEMHTSVQIIYDTTNHFYQLKINDTINCFQ